MGESCSLCSGGSGSFTQHDVCGLFLASAKYGCVDGWQTIHPFPGGWAFGLFPGSSYYRDFFFGGHMHSLRYIPSSGIAGSYGKCMLNFSIHHHTVF